MSNSSPFGIGPLHLKSFFSLVRATPLRESEAKKWGIGNGFNDYKLLADYLANLTPESKRIIREKTYSPGLHLESEMPKIENLFLPIIDSGSFPPDEELIPLMQKYDIHNKEDLEIGLYYFLFRTTNYGTELRACKT